MASSSHYHYHREDDDDEFEAMVEEFLEIPDFISPPKPRKKRIVIERNREQGHMKLWDDYFSENPTYPHNLFRRRFRMNKTLFLYIVDRITQEFEYFQLKVDAAGRSSLSPHQKCTAAIRQLAYGCGPDAYDEYVRMAETTGRKCLELFTAGIVHLFGEEYLRHPTPEDLQRLLYVGEQRGFPGMIGSIDCMHWEWKNCPAAWKGMYSRGTGKPTIVLEAVASQDLWIWHAFFGAPGTMNDINILDRSPVFDEIIHGKAPQVNFHVNGREYDLAYYLADGIYPKWATFIQSIRLPQGEKACLFAKKQEGARKDVERAFAALQSRFAIIRNPANLWDKNKIGNIMKACIILHNMIVENERGSYVHASEFQQREDEDPTFVVSRPQNLTTALGRRADVRDTPGHLQLKADLVEHIWAKFGHLPPNYM